MRADFGIFVLCGVLAGNAASAQTVRSDFEKLPVNEPIVFVVPAQGGEVKGRLIAFDPESLALSIDGRRVEFQRDEVRRIYRLGDPYEDGGRLGGIIGGIVGAALVGAHVGACNSAPERSREGCSPLTKTALFAIAVPLGFALGSGFGLIIDYEHTGRTLIYERPRSGSSPFAASRTPARTGVALTIRW
ncbi:MAG TPA: hypothetical protein VH740_08755 [Vicinamibacterales bacterium]|jgi:hypothetical protein